MSLLGIDAGTSGCKAGILSDEGVLLATAYREYSALSPQPGWAELDSIAVWELVKDVIREVVAAAPGDPVKALSVSSLGEAVVPVTLGRQILGPSLLNYDVRGEEYMDEFRAAFADDELYALNGNTPGNQFGLTKLMWLARNKPELLQNTDALLTWAGFICFMLGAEPVSDYSLANRLLCFDLEQLSWSDHVLKLAGIDKTKLPPLVASGVPIGSVSRSASREIGLPEGALIVSGGHDQSINAVGCGVTTDGRAMYGMGTYHCMVPVVTGRPSAEPMMNMGFSTEHHALPGRFVSFLYNPGGALLKWYRDAFAQADHERCKAAGIDTYESLLAEMPAEPSELLVLPYWMTMGPPDYVSDASGVVVGLRTETSRGEVLKGVLEGIGFSMRVLVDGLDGTGMSITDFRAVGGGAKCKAWLQLTADILGRPVSSMGCSEAGIMGAAILAGSAAGLFKSPEEAAEQMATVTATYEPDKAKSEFYNHRFGQYQWGLESVLPLSKRVVRLSKG